VTSLSIACVTQSAPHARPFLEGMATVARSIGAQFVLAVDGGPCDVQADVTVWVQSRGFLESVLDEAVWRCGGDYVLRLDDDERCSPAMVAWLLSGAWRASAAWKFATAGLWGTAQDVLVMPELWPQYHVRLTTKALAAGQTRIHQRHRADAQARVAPCVLEHHKFLVKSLDERKAIRQRYERVQPGAGKACHSVPELAYEALVVAPLGDGTLRTWAPEEIRRVPLATAEAFV
jgi:hypothetical protein